jgi:hemoglobin
MLATLHLISPRFWQEDRLRMRSSSLKRLGLVPAMAVAGLCACLAFSAVQADAVARRSLYERVGGQPAMTAISSELVDQATADPRTQRSWQKVELKRVKNLLTEYLCYTTGGPCAYSGDTMKEVHAGLKINEAEMNAMVEMLRDIMIKRGIALRERNEVLAVLAPTKRDVVTQ